MHSVHFTVSYGKHGKQRRLKLVIVDTLVTSHLMAISLFQVFCCRDGQRSVTSPM